MPNPEGAVTKLKHVAILLASCVLIGGFTTNGSAQYQSWDRDWRERDRDDRDRGWRGRGGDDDDDRGRRGRGRDDDDNDRDRRWRGRDDDDDDRRGRGRDRDWRGFYDRGSDCYYVRRRFVERDGDVIIRRYRVCND